MNISKLRLNLSWKEGQSLTMYLILKNGEKLMQSISFSTFYSFDMMFKASWATSRFQKYVLP